MKRRPALALLCLGFLGACGGEVVAGGGATKEAAPGGPAPSAGEVSPVEIATAVGTPFALAIDDTHVFWVDSATSGGVYGAPKSGGAVTELYRGSIGQVESIGLDGESVYFPANGSILAAPRSGSGAGGGARVVAAGGARGVAVARGSVYWVEAESLPAGGTAAGVTTAPTGGGAVVTRTVPRSTGGVAHAIVAADDAVYATLPTGGGIARIPFEGAEIELFAAPMAQGIGVAGDRIFFSTPGTIGSLPIRGGAPDELADAELAFGVAADEAFVYAASERKGQILKVARSGGPVTVLASEQRGAHAIAVDETHVYWTCAGAVRKIAK